MPVARSVRTGEVDRAGEIGAIAFDADRETWQRAWHRHADRYGLDSLLVVEHEGALVSSMVIVPEDMNLGDTVVRAGAVAGVATIPEARRIGCAGAMMRETVRRLREWGMVASPMWPFSYAYYRKFGWELGGEVRVVTWEGSPAWQIAPEGDISGATMDQAGEIGAVWASVGPRYRCSTVRTPAHWERFLGRDGYDGSQPNKGALLCRQGGRPAGYLFYNVPEPKEGQEKPPVDVAEFRYVNETAAVALLQALAERLPDQSFRVALSVSDRLRSVAVNARDFNTEVHSSFGFRIVDPLPVLRTMRTDAPQEPVRIHVEDELVGSRTYEACFFGGLADASETDAEPQVSCTIQTFSQMASGFLKPADAARATLLSGDAGAVARLQAATAHWTLPFRSGMEEG